METPTEKTHLDVTRTTTEARRHLHVVIDRLPEGLVEPLTALLEAELLYRAGLWQVDVPSASCAPVGPAV